MGFTVYFLNTFPSEAQVSKIFRLFTDLFWDIDQIKFETGSYRSFIGRKEDIVVVSPEIDSPFIYLEELVLDHINLFLPLSTAKWGEVEKLLQKVWEEENVFHKRLFVYRSYPDIVKNLPVELVDSMLFNEKYISIISEERIPLLETEDFFTYEGEELEEVVGKLLRKHQLTVSTAESCTGGLVAATLVNVSGSSEYFKGSVVAYSNEVKEKLLGVKRETLQKYGAVSAQTAEEMALGVRKLLKTDIGIATTGIAGPGGGTAEKPVGLTYFAVAYPKGVEVFKKVFPYDRNQNRLSATYYVLYQLYKILKKGL